MLTVILIVAAAIVFYVAQKKIRQGIKAKDLQEKSLQAAAVNVSTEPKPTESAKPDTVKQPQPPRSRGQTRAAVKPQNSNTATPSHEPNKKSNKTRARAKK